MVAPLSCLALGLPLLASVEYREGAGSARETGLNAREWLESFEAPMPYTVLRTAGGRRRGVGWRHHVARLAEGGAALLGGDSAGCDDFELDQRLRAAAAAALEGLPAAAGAEAVVALALAEDGRALAHATPEPAEPSAGEVEAELLRGAARDRPRVKDSAWCAGRRGLEEELRARLGSASGSRRQEGLLVDSGGNDILEGLTTNFFAYTAHDRTL